MGVPCPAAAGVLPGEAPGPCGAPKSPALVSASDVPPVPGNPSLDSFTLPRWERTYLGVFRSLTRRSPPARDGGTLPPRAPGPRLFPRDADSLTPHEPRTLCPPDRCFCPFHSWPGRGSATTCARGWVDEGVPLGCCPMGPLERLLGWELLPPTPSCTWQLPHPSSAPGHGSQHRETQKEEKQDGGEKYLKVQKRKKKIPPSLRFFFFPWKHFQLYKCPDVGCTAPAPRSAPVANSQRCSSRGGRSAAGALAPSPAAASSREPLAPEHHRQKEGRGRKEGGGVERDIVSPKSIFFYFFTCRHELHCEPRPGSDLIGIGVGRGSFQKYMFILGDFSGFIYRSGSQPVL